VRSPCCARSGASTTDPSKVEEGVWTLSRWGSWTPWWASDRQNAEAGLWEVFVGVVVLGDMVVEPAAWP